MNKVFCLGFGSTGTTTLHATAQAAGLRCLHGNQWTETTRDPIFSDFVKAHNQVPPEDYPGAGGFCKWQDWDFFSDGQRAAFELLDHLFPGSYFILNTRSRYNWLTGIYNHLQRNRSDPDYAGTWLIEPTAAHLYQRMQTRLSYHSRVVNYFKERDNFAVVDVEAQAESQVCEILRTATGRPVENLHTANVYKTDVHYEHDPPVVAEALKRHEFSRDQWHLSLL